MEYTIIQYCDIVKFIIFIFVSSMYSNKTTILIAY